MISLPLTVGVDLHWLLAFLSRALRRSRHCGDRCPHALRGGRHVDVPDPEVGHGVDDGVLDGRASSRSCRPRRCPSHPRGFRSVGVSLAASSKLGRSGAGDRRVVGEGGGERVAVRVTWSVPRVCTAAAPQAIKLFGFEVPWKLSRNQPVPVFSRRVLQRRPGPKSLGRRTPRPSHSSNVRPAQIQRQHDRERWSPQLPDSPVTHAVSPLDQFEEASQQRQSSRSGIGVVGRARVFSRLLSGCLQECLRRRRVL